MNLIKSRPWRRNKYAAILQKQFKNRGPNIKSVSELSAISKVPLIASGVNESVTCSDFESDTSKSEEKEWCYHPSSNYVKYLPNYFHKPEHRNINLSQTRDEDSILRIVQSKNLQKAIMEGYSPSVGKQSWNSDSGEHSETTTSGYCSGNNEIAVQLNDKNKNDVISQRIVCGKPAVYSRGCNLC